MAFASIAELLKTVREQNKPMWEVILEDDLKERGTHKEDSFAQMKSLWLAMKSASANYDGNLRSASGLSGGDGQKMAAYTASGDSISGPFLGAVMQEALKMGESNACMKRIVAAPTAGACGVLPAVLLPFAAREHVSDDDMTRALYVSAAFGQVIALRASISGAKGGCQAEIGSASAMAAAMLVALKNGSAEQSAHACAMALKNLLGLVCDPVAGLVEVPCIKRNVIGAVNAISSADMALAGIESRIPPDEVIDAMQAIGDMMPTALRETSGGGLAQTPTAQEIEKAMHTA